MFTSLDDRYTTPSEELRHFTNRVGEQAAFQRLLDLPCGEPVPVLMYYGVGGAGKSWLLNRLRERAAALPTAYLNLDPRIGGAAYHNDWARALAEARRQLGPQVRCPRFDLAYTWLRFKEGVQNEPHFQGTGLLGNAWELLVEAGSAAASDVPGASIVAWLFKKAAAPVAAWLKDSGVGDWLATSLGKDDFLRLKAQLPGDIYPQLHERLLKDLHENLPPLNDRAVRAVVFLDTVETIRDARDSDSRLFDQQERLRNLYHPESGLLLVLGGRDHLHWGHESGSAFADRRHLEQHLVGGLSEQDAREFLTRCDVTDDATQQAILRVSVDVETAREPSHAADAAHVPDVGYHAFSLGLCADACWNLRRQGEPIDPDSFDMAPDDTRKLAARFLRSLGGDGAYAEWLHRLAATVRFDETAARAAFSDHAGAEQDAAWKGLLSYSFVRPAEDPGWHTLHVRMRDALEDLERRDSQDGWIGQHEWWQAHWSDRSVSKFDAHAAQSWHHHWMLDPHSARETWQRWTDEERRWCRMENHFSLLHWWSPCRLEDWLSDSDRREEAAAALNSLGIEHASATRGNRSENLKQAIDCCTAALRVRTEADYPQDWAMTQNNLGCAHHDMPTGDREENLRRAIACHTAALRVRTETDSPLQWAMTKNNLGNAYLVSLVKCGWACYLGANFKKRSSKMSCFGFTFC